PIIVLAPLDHLYASKIVCLLLFTSFFFDNTATTAIYTLSLHDALPISQVRGLIGRQRGQTGQHDTQGQHCDPSRVLHRGSPPERDRKSTRLNSSHVSISYAVFCLKKKKIKKKKSQTKKEIIIKQQKSIQQKTIHALTSSITSLDNDSINHVDIKSVTGQLMYGRIA